MAVNRNSGVLKEILAAISGALKSIVCETLVLEGIYKRAAVVVGVGLGISVRAHPL